MKSHYSSYKKYEPTESFDSIIIGSGISGLSLGSILSKEGERVMVLEQHYVPGGMTHTFKRNEYEWDVGVHYVGDVEEGSFIKSAYDYVCETPIEWADMGEVYDCAYYGDDRFEFKKGTKSFLTYFKELFPQESDALDEYMDLLLTMGDYSIGYYAFKIGDAFENKDFANQLRDKYLVYASRTTKSVMDELFTSEKLKAVLTSQYGNIGLTPEHSSFAMHSSIANHYMNGGFYPVGGSNVFFEKIAPVITNSGGQILVRAVVSEIIVENGKAIGVIMNDGKKIFADKIISTVGIELTYKHLLNPSIKNEFNILEKIKDLTNSISYCCLYIGMKHTAEELEIPKSNFWIFPDNYNHDKNSDDFYSGKSDKRPIVYISFPGAKDPDFTNRFPNKCTIEIVVFEQYDKFKKWETTKWKHRGDEYNQYKEDITNELLEYLYKYLPQTKGKIDYAELSSPLTAKHFGAHSFGELYGINHTPERFGNDALQPTTPISNLYLSGHDIVTAGVAGGLISAVITASRIKNINFIDKIFWE